MPNSDELTYVSFPISKFDKTDDGDLIVYGKATDGTVDSDEQIVDPKWSAKALQEWLETGGNVRVQHQASRDPAGKGLQVETTPDGHYVRALVVEPVAKRLVEKGVLTAYSVGIMRPVIERDPTGKARGGIIRSGTLAELSLVDRPANKNCGLVMAKSAGGSPAELVTELFGEPEFLAKATGDDQLMTKVADAVSRFAFTPNDMARLHQTPSASDPSDGHGGGGLHSDPVIGQLAAAFKRDKDPNVGGGVDRDKLPDADFAGRNRSFPIVTPGDVSDAATSIGRAGADNYSSDQLRSNIIRIARRKGPEFVSQLPDAWRDDHSVKEAEVEIEKGSKDCTKCGKSYHADSKLRNCEGCGADLPHADKTVDVVTDGGAVKECGTCGGKGTIRDGNMKCPDCEGSSEKASSPGDGVKDKDTDTAAAHREPDGDDAEELEQDAGMEDGDEGEDGDEAEKCANPADGVKDKDVQMAPEVGHEFEDTDLASEGWSGKAVDYTVARLHDALCAAYSFDSVQATYPALKGVGDAIDLQTCTDDVTALMQAGDLAGASEAVMLASVAKAITSAHPQAVNDARAALHKSFTDMHPGPGNAVTPTSMTPGKFRRPYISAGHAPLSAQASGGQPPAPNAHEVTADDFNRGALTGGHADSSPGNKTSPSPAYAAAQSAAAMTAIKELHDHIAGRHEWLCPMTLASTDQPQAVGPGDAGVFSANKSASTADGTLNKVATSQTVTIEGVEQALKRALAAQSAGVTTAPNTPTNYLTAETVEKMLDTRMASALSERDQTIADLRKQIDDLASQPDPNKAPLRGIVANKSNSSGGAGQVDRRSLIDEARNTELLHKLAFVRELAKSGNPVLADQARTEESRLLEQLGQK